VAFSEQASRLPRSAGNKEVANLHAFAAQQDLLVLMLAVHFLCVIISHAYSV
jgi:hypothetical protein